jgi:chemotaxis response regulator CheB
MFALSGTEHMGEACKIPDTDPGTATWLVSIAGSAGALASLNGLLDEFPGECPAAIVVAMHSAPGSVLVDVLRVRSKLPVEWAITGTLLRPGRIYVASPAAHLIVNPDARLTVSRARHGRFRPSADWLFESAAASFERRHIAIVLSGLLSDGASKLRRVRAMGGRVLVEDPETCRFASMPRAAIATGHVDAVLPVAAMRGALQEFLQQPYADALAAWEEPFNPELRTQN